MTEQQIKDGIKQLKGEIFNELLYRWVEEPCHGDWDFCAEERDGALIIELYIGPKHPVFKVDKDLNIQFIREVLAEDGDDSDVDEA
jgi:hypothetical protein